MEIAGENGARTGIEIAIELIEQIVSIRTGNLSNAGVSTALITLRNHRNIARIKFKTQSMLLTIDIGNTNLTLGLYEGTNLGARWRLATDHDRMPDEYGLQILGLLQHGGCSPAQLDGMCLASVVPPLTGRIAASLQKYLHQDPPLLIDYTSSKPASRYCMMIPTAVGADRIVDAVAVHELYGGPACVVDFGTATTFNAINCAMANTWAARSPPGSASR